MIKLIATDLDGTLLYTDKSAPPRLERLVDELNARGILFSFASGRAITSLRDKFGSLLDKTGCICSNGCMLAVRGEIVHTNVLTKAQIDEVLEEAARTPCLESLLIGVDKEYYITENKQFIDLMARYCTAQTKVEDYADVIGRDTIIKVSFFDPVDPITHGMKALSGIADRYVLIPSGDEWLDTVPIGEDKGACLARLQQYLGVTPEETMCFGDYHNDAGLMKHCKYSYAMKNAHPDLKALCSYETELTNDEDGVIETICRELGITL